MLLEKYRYMEERKMKKYYEVEVLEENENNEIKSSWVINAYETYEEALECLEYNEPEFLRNKKTTSLLINEIVEDEETEEKEINCVYDLTLRKERRKEEIEDSIYYALYNAWLKDNFMYYLEQLPYAKNSDYDYEVHEYIKQLGGAIRSKDQDEYEIMYNELVEHYIINYIDYDF